MWEHYEQIKIFKYADAFVNIISYSISLLWIVDRLPSLANALALEHTQSKQLLTWYINVVWLMWSKEAVKVANEGKSLKEIEIKLRLF